MLKEGRKERRKEGNIWSGRTRLRRGVGAKGIVRESMIRGGRAMEKERRESNGI